MKLLGWWQDRMEDWVGCGYGEEDMGFESCLAWGKGGKRRNKETMMRLKRPSLGRWMDGWIRPYDTTRRRPAIKERRRVITHTPTPHHRRKFTPSINHSQTRDQHFTHKQLFSPHLPSLSPRMISHYMPFYTKLESKFHDISHFCEKKNFEGTVLAFSLFMHRESREGMV